MSVDFETVFSVIKATCFLRCCKQKQAKMAQFESYAPCEGFIRSLVQIINVQEQGSTMEVDCRHLAAIVLKNTASQHWCNRFSKEEVWLVNNEEKDYLRKFLATYLYEPECKIAMQLATLTANLLKFD